MKTFILIAWRNLWRNKRRSLVVITSIALGIFAMIFSIAFMNGIMTQMVENTISTSLGHVAIHRKGFQDSLKLEYNFRPEEKILTAISRTPHVKSFAPRIKIPGMLRSAEASRGVMIVGIDPDREKSISKIFDYTSREGGSDFIQSPSDDSILISKTMAKKLDILVGDRIVLMVQDRNKEIVGVGLTVRGVYQTPVESFDKFIAFTGIKHMQEITGLNDNLSEINILLTNKAHVDTVKRSLTREIADPSLEILTWKDMAPSLVSLIKLFNTMMYIFFAIVFATVIFSIANTLIMAIMERFHEIGVMKSIGTRPGWIFSMVMFEAVNLGAVGLCAGIVAGGALVGVLSVTGMDFSFYSESMRVYGSGSVIYPVIKALDILAATGIVMLTTIIAALYPAQKAARIKPLEALNYI